MEFRLNKIDTEIRQVVNDATKDGKVHGSKDLTKINKDRKKGKREENQEEFKKKLENIKKKDTTFEVQAVKIKNIKVDASIDKDAVDLSQGRFLDTKR